MYGSSFTRETLILRDSRIAAREAAAMPLPSEETTPPVTKTYLVMCEPRAGNFNFTALGSSFGLPLQRTSHSTAATLPALDEELDEAGSLNAGGGVNLRLGLAGTTIGGCPLLPR